MNILRCGVFEGSKLQSRPNASSQWTREEGLAEIVENGVQFIDLPIKVKEDTYTDEGLVHRLQRQMHDIKVVFISHSSRFGADSENIESPPIHAELYTSLRYRKV